jgi:hypothetical protein
MAVIMLLGLQSCGADSGGTMSKDIESQVEEQARVWSGIACCRTRRVAGLPAGWPR